MKGLHATELALTQAPSSPAQCVDGCAMVATEAAAQSLALSQVSAGPTSLKLAQSPAPLKNTSPAAEDLNIQQIITCPPDLVAPKTKAETEAEAKVAEDSAAAAPGGFCEQAERMLPPPPPPPPTSPVAPLDVAPAAPVAAASGPAKMSFKPPRPVKTALVPAPVQTENPAPDIVDDDGDAVGAAVAEAACGSLPAGSVTAATNDADARPRIKAPPTVATKLPAPVAGMAKRRRLGSTLAPAPRPSTIAPSAVREPAASPTKTNFDADSEKVEQTAASRAIALSRSFAGERNAPPGSCGAIDDGSSF